MLDKTIWLCYTGIKKVRYGNAYHILFFTIKNIRLSIQLRTYYRMVRGAKNRHNEEVETRRAYRIDNGS